MMRIVGIAVIASLVGCSFAMQKSPSTWRVEEEVLCSESYAAAGFDATIAVSAALVALISTSQFSSNHGCLDSGTYGYPSCGYYNWNIGGGIATALAFGYASYVGDRWAGRCRKMHDEHDHWIATQLSPEAARERNVCLVARTKAAAQIADDAERQRMIDNTPCGESAAERARLRNACLIERHKLSAQLTDPLEAERLVSSMPCGEETVAFKSKRPRSEYGGISGGLLGGVVGLIFGAVALQPRY